MPSRIARREITLREIPLREIPLREIPLREIPLFRLGRAISSPFVTFYLRFSECLDLDDLVNVSAPESCRTKDYFRINELARLLSSDFRNVGRPLMTPASGAATNVPVAEESSRRVAHARLDGGHRAGLRVRRAHRHLLPLLSGPQSRAARSDRSPALRIAKGRQGDQPCRPSSLSEEVLRSLAGSLQTPAIRPGASRAPGA